MTATKTAPPLSVDERLREDRILFERLHDPQDPIDRDTLVERFLPLARSLAARYAGRGEPFDDLVQVAGIGLVKAVDRFDTARGIAFSSYAVPTILGEIRRYFRDRTWSVHVPRDLQELTLAVQAKRDELERRHGRAPTVGQVAEALGVTDEDVLDAIRALRAQRPASLDAPRSEDDETAEATVGATIGVEEKGFERAERRDTVQRLARVLTTRERVVLRLRYEHDLTQEQIGKRIGLSQMQISRILRGAIAKLRSYARQQGMRGRGRGLAAGSRG